MGRTSTSATDDLYRGRMAGSCYLGGTSVAFTALREPGIVVLSSSGGGLFRRPMTRMGSRGAFLCPPEPAFRVTTARLLGLL